LTIWHSFSEDQKRDSLNACRKQGIRLRETCAHLLAVGANVPGQVYISCQQELAPVLAFKDFTPELQEVNARVLQLHDQMGQCSKIQTLVDPKYKNSEEAGELVEAVAQLIKDHLSNISLLEIKRMIKNSKTYFKDKEYSIVYVLNDQSSVVSAAVAHVVQAFNAPVHNMYISYIVTRERHKGKGCASMILQKIKMVRDTLCVFSLSFPRLSFPSVFPLHICVLPICFAGCRNHWLQSNFSSSNTIRGGGRCESCLGEKRIC
jgi:hypothetical protein